MQVISLHTRTRTKYLQHFDDNNVVADLLIISRSIPSKHLPLTYSTLYAHILESHQLNISECHFEDGLNTCLKPYQLIESNNVRLCKLDCVVLMTFSVTFQPQSHLRCSGVQKSISVFLLHILLLSEPYIFQPPRTSIPASEDFDRILWLWLILTESELWRTPAESFLRKVIPKRKIVSAPSRAKDLDLWRSAW